jgi:hypothetical protein
MADFIDGWEDYEPEQVAQADDVDDDQGHQQAAPPLALFPAGRYPTKP